MDARAERLGGDAVIWIAGTFDAIAAMRLGATLAELTPEGAAVLDFSRAQEVTDLALGVLATAISESRHPRLVLRGLTHHHERMLQYLGIDALVLERRNPIERMAEAGAGP
jgi:hypothetical protein